MILTRWCFFLLSCPAVVIAGKPLVLDHFLNNPVYFMWSIRFPALYFPLFFHREYFPLFHRLWKLWKTMNKPLLIVCFSPQFLHFIHRCATYFSTFPQFRFSTALFSTFHCGGNCGKPVNFLFLSSFYPLLLWKTMFLSPIDPFLFHKLSIEFSAVL